MSAGAHRLPQPPFGPVERSCYRQTFSWMFHRGRRDPAVVPMMVPTGALLAIAGQRSTHLL
jgi:hypothetical protein